ncbi:hypothetical protein Tco_0863196 [Tanacetum coccineum]
MVLPWSVTIPPSTGNLSILWAVDRTAWIFLRSGLPMMPLYGDGDLTIMKFIKALVECSSSPRDTINEICPNGQDISPLNPKSRAVARIRWPSASASITIGLSYPSLLVRGGKEISWLAEKLWVTLCLVIRCQGWTMKIVAPLLGASHFFAAFLCSPLLPPYISSLIRFEAVLT